jgi:hypothetical protein
LEDLVAYAWVGGVKLRSEPVVKMDGVQIEICLVLREKRSQLAMEARRNVSFASRARKKEQHPDAELHS